MGTCTIAYFSGAMAAHAAAVLSQVHNGASPIPAGCEREMLREILTQSANTQREDGAIDDRECFSTRRRGFASVPEQQEPSDEAQQRIDQWLKQSHECRHLCPFQQVGGVCAILMPVAIIHYSRLSGLRQLTDPWRRYPEFKRVICLPPAARHIIVGQPDGDFPAIPTS